jgi:DNA-directed RNA polymerase specialized sigma24 family protein
MHYLSTGSIPIKVRNVVSATTNRVIVDYQRDLEGPVLRYSPLIFRVALGRLRNIEDAAQDAPQSAYKHIGQFEGRSQLYTWLTTIVSNVALMKLRLRAAFYLDLAFPNQVLFTFVATTKLTTTGNCTRRVATPTHSLENTAHFQPQGYAT